MNCPSVDSGAFPAPIMRPKQIRRCRTVVTPPQSTQARSVLPALVNRRQRGASWSVEPESGTATYRVRDEGGRLLGRVVAPRHPQAPGFGGETIYLDHASRDTAA